VRAWCLAAWVVSGVVFAVHIGYAAEVRKHRQRPGRRWWVNEVVFFRNKAREKRYLYRAVDEHG
jgi:hypothetical protein